MVSLCSGYGPPALADRKLFSRGLQQKFDQAEGRFDIYKIWDYLGSASATLAGWRRITLS